MHKMFAGHPYLFLAMIVIQAIDDVKKAYPDNFEIGYIWYDLVEDSSSIVDSFLRMDGESFIERTVESRIRQLVAKHGISA